MNKIIKNEILKYHRMFQVLIIQKEKIQIEFQDEQFSF